MARSIDVLPFAATLKEMIASESIQEAGQVRHVFFDDTTSPELHMRVKQSVFAASESDESTGVSCSYQLRVMVDPGIKNGSIGVSDEGPAMILEPSGEDLLRFARDWQSEAEMALLLG